MNDLRATPWAGRYGILYADPAWQFLTRSPRGQGGKGPSAHYRTSPLDEMAALPVADVAAADCFLFLWTTWPILAAGTHAKLVQGWSDPANPWVGVTGGAWAKRPRNWRGDPGKWQFGNGYLLRSASEPLLIYRRGKVRGFANRSERNLWVAPIREHSRKPDLVREMIDRAVPGVPRLELFSRAAGEGWDHWGDEAGTFRPRDRS